MVRRMGKIFTKNRVEMRGVGMVERKNLGLAERISIESTDKRR